MPEPTALPDIAHVNGEHAMLTEFLDYFRTVFLRKVEDLADEQSRQRLLQGSQRGLVALDGQPQPASLAFEESAQSPVLAVVLPPERSSILQFCNRRQLRVVFQPPQVCAQAAVSHAR